MGNAYCILLFMTARRVTYKSWAGITIRGNTKWQASSVKKENHLDKATWLTAAVEGGSMFGTVQGYDGCGMSAGLEHCIGLLPRSMEPGSLWGLLLKIDEALPDTNPNWVAMKAAMDTVGWYLDTKGALRNKTTGASVGGQEIRNELSPVGGVVPESGPDFDKAVRWAELFNRLFEDSATFPCQIRQTKNGLLTSHKDIENQVYARYCKLENASAAVVGTNISAELDLAMCVYHSFSVNAPSKARAVLTEVFGRNLGSMDFSKALIKALGTNTYANWQDRYVRTRQQASNSGLFDAGLFASAAPAHF
jgi:hypothetical protein